MSDTVTPEGFNTPIPAKIMTPDRVETRIGTLEFDDGFPTQADGRPAVRPPRLPAGRRGLPQSGCRPRRWRRCASAWSSSASPRANQVAIVDDLLDSNPLFLTGNTDTVYVSAILDLERDGPTVIEIPPGCGPTTVNDAWFRFITDMGKPGPDRGQGGKYLIVPPGYDGPRPDGCYVSETPSRINWLISAACSSTGSPRRRPGRSTRGSRSTRCRGRTIRRRWSSSPCRARSSTPSTPTTSTFFEELDAVIQREPLGVIDDEIRGLLAPIGIRKGTPFAPDERMKGLLTEAVEVANGTARAISFKTRDPEAMKYPDRRWKTAFIGNDYRWLVDDGVGGRNLDARTLFFYLATVNTPAMALHIPGVGSQYAYTEHDSTGEYLDGATVVLDALSRRTSRPRTSGRSSLYDPQTRSELQTGQPYPSLNNTREPDRRQRRRLVRPHIRPDEPAEDAENWIQTVPGKKWFTILRLYGPLEPWFDKTWMPGDIEPA